MDFKGMNVLVIGGTGSIGGAIVDNVLKKNPRTLRVFSRDEHKQFKLQRRLRGYKNVRYLLGDIRNSERVHRAMKDVDIVFHAAALKHVPSCEFNPFEAVETNVKGTQNIVNAAIDNNVRKVITISTDKAAGGLNVMGATKLLAERVVTAANYYKGKRRTLLASVRCGNVAGTRGSVIPLFVEQLMQDGFVTITEPEMTRFMMTVNEAVGLIFNAMGIMKGGEVFILKMPVLKLDDLADAVIDRMKNKVKVRKNPKKIIGMRPGERLHEILLTSEEVADAVELPGMFVIIPRIEIPNRRKLVYRYKGQKKAIPAEYASNDSRLMTPKEIQALISKAI